MNFWFSVYPDIEKPIGGVKQIHRLAECLIALGHNCTLVQGDQNFHPGWFKSSVPTTSLKSFQSSVHSLESPILVIPETFVAGINNYFPGIPKIIFNQNGSYTFGVPTSKSLPDPAYVISCYKHPDVAHVLCVSEYDRSFLIDSLHLPDNTVTRIFNSIDISPHSSVTSKNPIVCFMRRKNPIHSRIVYSLLKAGTYRLPWRFKSIDNLPHQSVLNILSESLVFLSFGHPEGFGLPVAEAFACGCAVIGYSGLGGNELFELHSNQLVSKKVDYSDFHGFANAFSQFDHHIHSNVSEFMSQLTKSSSATIDLYSRENMIRSVSFFLSRFRATQDS